MGGIARFFTSIYNGLMGIQKCFAEDAGTKRRISYGKQETGGVGLSAADHIFRNLHWLWYCVFGYGSGKSFWLFPTPCSVACGNCVCPYSGTGGEDFREGRCLYGKYGPQRCYDDRSDLSYASGFQGAAAAIGGKTSVINLCLHYIPVKLLVPGVFMMCCFISTAIGTSMGTMAAMAPVALGVAEGAGLNAAIVCAAVIGGSYFGDNLSMISDTTIAAAEGCGSEMRDKFRMNFFIAFPAAVLSLIFYGFIGGAGSGSIEVGAFDLFQIAPYIVVLVTALMGINVAVVLFIGILMTFIVGLLQGNVGFFDIAMAVGDGMADMFSISIVAILVSGVIGLVRYYGGIEWMIDTITKKIKNRKQAEYGIGILSGILSGAMVNNTIAIIVTCPIAKEIGSKYKIAPKRLASLVDIFACAFLAVMPHDGGMLMTSEMANISPFAILPYSVYPLFLIIATCITIQAGLLRTAEEKQKK